MAVVSASDLDGRVALVRGAVAELADVVDAPARDRTRFDDARVAHSGIEARGIADTAHLDRRQTTHGAAVAELALRVASPAIHVAVADNRGGVPIPGSDRRHVIQSTHGHRRTVGRRRPIAQLPFGVVAPAAHGAGGRDTAGVIASGVDRDIDDGYHNCRTHVAVDVDDDVGGGVGVDADAAVGAEFGEHGVGDDVVRRCS